MYQQIPPPPYQPSSYQPPCPPYSYQQPYPPYGDPSGAQPPHRGGLFLRAAVSLEHLREGGFYLVKMQSHRLSSRRINVIKLSSCSSNETPPVSGALFSHSRQ